MKSPVVSIDKSPLTSIEPLSLVLVLVIFPEPAFIVVLPPKIIFPVFSKPWDLIFTDFSFLACSFIIAWIIPLFVNLPLASTSKLPPVIILPLLSNVPVFTVVSFVTLNVPVFLKLPLVLFSLSTDKLPPIAVVRLFSNPPPLIVRSPLIFTSLVSSSVVSLVPFSNITFPLLFFNVISAFPPTAKSCENLALAASNSISFWTFKDLLSKAFWTLATNFFPTVIISLIKLFPSTVAFVPTDIFPPFFISPVALSVKASSVIMIPFVVIPPSLASIFIFFDSRFPTPAPETLALKFDSFILVSLKSFNCLLNSSILVFSVAFCNCSSNSVIFVSSSSKLFTLAVFNASSYSFLLKAYFSNLSFVPSEVKLFPEISILSPAYNLFVLFISPTALSSKVFPASTTPLFFNELFEFSFILSFPLIIPAFSSPLSPFVMISILFPETIPKLSLFNWSFKLVKSLTTFFIWSNLAWIAGLFVDVAEFNWYSKSATIFLASSNDSLDNA